MAVVATSAATTGANPHARSEKLFADIQSCIDRLFAMLIDRRIDTDDVTTTTTADRMYHQRYETAAYINAMDQYSRQMLHYNTGVLRYMASHVTMPTRPPTHLERPVKPFKPADFF